MYKDMNHREINSYLRSISKKPRSSNCHCEFCNSKEDVQLHHIIPIEELGRIAWLNNYHSKEQLDNMYIETIWLCDKHHKMVHELDSKNYNDELIDLDDIYNVIDMLQQIDISQAPPELYEDYKNEVDRMQDMILYTLVEKGDLSLKELNEVEKIIDEEFYTNEENENEIGI